MVSSWRLLCCCPLLSPSSPCLLREIVFACPARPALLYIGLATREALLIKQLSWHRDVEFVGRQMYTQVRVLVTPFLLGVSSGRGVTGVGARGELWRAAVVLYSFLCLLFVVRDLEFGERSVLWVLFSSYFVAVL